ncbi:MAG: APC family permease [Hydrogenovibrio sp.]|nr:APC family permease [Hydrogenovibrio sp.]
MQHSSNHHTQYQANSLSLIGAIALGTGVMIGAGIFALTGQMAELAGPRFPLAFLAAAIVVAFSAYSYIKLSNAYPSAGGIAMYLQKAYGNSVTTAFHALLMYCSMVIAQSLLARTFGSYTLQLFNHDVNPVWVPILGVLLLVLAFAINLSGNRMIQGVASTLAFIKLIGIIVFGLAGILVADQLGLTISGPVLDTPNAGFLAATGLGILAFKGFTTITNSGSELVNPHKNVGRAILIAILICVAIYALVGFAVSSNLSLNEIVRARDYALAAAARPATGNLGLVFTVLLAMIATVGGIIASIFAVSRMLAMLTEMKLVPHSHFGMPGSIQKHTLVYTVVLGVILTAFFDLTRIAALGIIFYLVMDIAVHWGVLRHLKQKVQAHSGILVTAIALDGLVLVGFIWVKLQTDPFVLAIAFITMTALLLMETLFLRRSQAD